MARPKRNAEHRCHISIHDRPHSPGSDRAGSEASSEASGVGLPADARGRGDGDPCTDASHPGGAAAEQVLSLSALALVAGMYLLVPALQGRQVHRMIAPQGEFQAVVDDSGVRVASRYSETTYRWPMLTRYTETDELFVLLTPDRYGIGIVVLPKRGASEPVDVDRLRDLLNLHATRVGPKRVRSGRPEPAQRG